MTITVTPDPLAAPPVNDLVLSVPGSAIMSSLLVWRNDPDGTRTDLRSQPVAGFNSRPASDPECPYEVEVTYGWSADYLAAGGDVFAETWASLASWTTSGASWSVSANRVIWSAADSLTASVLRAVTSGQYRIVFSAVPKGIWKIDFGGFYIDVLSSKMYIGTSLVSFSPGTTTWTIDVTDTSVTLTTSAGAYSVSGAALVTQVKFLGPVASYAFADKFGAAGSGNGQFGPFGVGGVVADGSGNVFVTDVSNNRVQKFNSSGVYQSQFGSAGSGNGQFNQPGAIAIDGSGNIYVSDRNNSRVQKFNSSGVYQSQFGSAGTGNGQFTSPCGIAFDGSGNIYVVDFGNRVQKFNSSGVYQSQFGSAGSGNGLFNRPQGIAIDGSGNIWVADQNNDRVQKFNSSGVYQSQLATSSPYALVFDSTGHLFVAGWGTSAVQKFSAAGDLLQVIAVYGTADGAARNATGVAIGSSSALWVTDDQARLQRFTRTATSITPVTVTAYGAVTTLLETSDPVTLDVHDTWLVHPAAPGKSFKLQNLDPLVTGIRTFGDLSRPSKANLVDVMGSDLPVPVTFGPRGGAQLSISIATVTDDERLALDTILADEVQLLVQVPPSWETGFSPGFYSFLTSLERRFVVWLSRQQSARMFEIPIVRVGSPVVDVENSGWSVGAVLAEFATVADVLATFDTTADLLVNNRS